MCGIGFDALRESEVITRVDEFLLGRIHESQKLQTAWGNSRIPQKFMLLTPNPEMVLKAQNHEAFKKVLNSAQLAVADGVGILWGSYFLSLPKRNFFTLISSLLAIIFTPKKIRKVIPARVSGSDLFPKLLQLASHRKKKVFLLGGKEGVGEKVKKHFEKKFPHLEIVGVSLRNSHESEEAKIREEIDASQASMLFVAFSFPHQEMWIARNLPKLKYVKFAMGVGGSFDFYGGVISRSPHFLRKIGLEWMWRLIKQPSRMGRIWNATFRFIKLVWKAR